ncbi:MAG: phosphoribosylformylglycinamidine cyclo-ligase [Micrococcales bacterium]|nr:phosphoribosylformylglycinamidine cyclo-ligase [Micrococcales bacterium]
MASPSAYARAGVDTEAGDRAVDLMKAAVGRTHGSEVMGQVGGFAGLWDACDLRNYDHPILATSTDGVGTKLAIAQSMDVHDTVGRDLVGMVVDDVVVCGARPLFMTDYIATGKVRPEIIATLVGGIAAGCAETGTALIGGETAEHPGTMAANEYDLAGAGVGVVEKADLLGARNVTQGDVVIGLASSGLHSNGYSLVRSVVARLGWTYDRQVSEFGRSLGEELLEPTRLYTRPCLRLAAALGSGPDGGLHALSHVTGGGLAANLARVIPRGLGAEVSRAAWTVPPVFDVLRQAGGLSWSDLEPAWNLGVGMLAVVAESAAGAALELLAESGQLAAPIGHVLAFAALDQEYQARRSVPADLTGGAKGVQGGQVLMVDVYSAG